MPNEWIIDVLSDLRLFAEQNGLVKLAEQIDDTVLVAATEIASGGSTSQRTTRQHEYPATGATA